MDGYKIVARGQRITFTWEHVRQGRCGRSGDASRHAATLREASNNAAIPAGQGASYRRESASSGDRLSREAALEWQAQPRK